MSNIRITTLPIALRDNPTFETFLSPVLAYAAAKLVGDAYPVVAVNLFGMKYEKALTDSEGKQIYADHLRHICGESFSPEVITDVSDEYVAQMHMLLNSKISDGSILQEQLKLLVCSCGRSQFPMDALASIALEPDVVERSGEGFRCVFCKSSLKEQVTDSLVMRPQSVTDQLTIYPDRYRKKAENQESILSGRPIIVSRTKRNTAAQYMLNGYSIDPDLWWACLPFMSLRNDEEVVIVTASKTLWHAIRTVHVARLLGVTSKVSILIHPYLQILDSESKLARMSVDEYRKAAASPAAARAFLLMGLQWGSDLSHLTSDELYLVNHSYQITSQIDHAKHIPVSRVIRVLQRNTFISLFKKLRSFNKIPLTDDEVAVAEAVLKPW